MPLHHVPFEPTVGGHRALKVHHVPHEQLAQVGPAPRLPHHVEGHVFLIEDHDREARAIHRDRTADLHVIEHGGTREREPGIGTLEDGGRGFDDSGEHGKQLSMHMDAYIYEICYNIIVSDFESDKWYYANTAAGFLDDANKEGFIPAVMQKRYEEKWNREPPISLLHSWEVTPSVLANALSKGRVKREEVVILEYCIDINNRVDALICGYEKEQATAMLIELKQWNELPIRSTERDDYLEMKFNHGWIEVEHPSAQALRYKNRMNELINTDEQNLRIIPYSFLPNCTELSKNQLSVLRGVKFGELFKKVPIYTSQYARALGNRIHERTRHQKGREVLKILESL